MSLDSQTFDHRKGLLQLGGLLSDSDSKKIVFLLGLPKALEEKAPWEVIAHLEAQGKATVEELTKILRAIDRQDAAKKAKELIGKNTNRKKTTDSGSKALMLRDSLQLAMKHCKILVEQVDYLKVAANKDGNKRIEQIASEAKENLISQVQKKLQYASVLFNSVESSSPMSSLEGSPTDRSPVSSPPSIVRNPIITANELKEAAENLKKQKGRPLRSNPHAIWRRITGGQLKKGAEKLKKKSTHKGGGASAATLYHDQAREEREGEEEEDLYSSIPEIMGAQNAISDPHYENLPLKRPHPPIACSENHLEVGSNGATLHPGAKLYTTTEGLMAIATSDVSSAEDCSTCSYTGDSGFSDSRAFMKGSSVSPPSTSEPAQHQGLDKSYASLNTADVRTGYYKSLNPETRIPDVIYEQTNTSGQSSMQ